jgi:hypothetical protein
MELDLARISSAAGADLIDIEKQVKAALNRPE